MWIFRWIHLDGLIACNVTATQIGGTTYAKTVERDLSGKTRCENTPSACTPLIVMLGLPRLLLRHLQSLSQRYNIPILIHLCWYYYNFNSSESGGIENMFQLLPEYIKNLWRLLCFYWDLIKLTISNCHFAFKDVLQEA